MRLGSAAAGMSFALLALVSARPAGAYCVKRFANASSAVTETIWRTEGAVRVAFSDTLDEQTRAALESAFEAWAGVTCSTLSFEFLAEPFPIADTSYEQPTSPQADIYVFWVTATGVPSDLPGGFAQIIAHTYPAHDREGKLTRASIAINDMGGTFRWKVLEADDKAFFDVQTAVLPLIGEVIGLTSSDQQSETVLKRGSIFSGLGERAPLRDDEEGLRHLYWDETCEDDQRPPGPAADSVCAPPPARVDAGSTDGGPADGGSSDGGLSDGGRRCTSNDECAEGEICDGDGRCVTRSADDDGCSCATRAQPAHVALGVLLLAAFACVRPRRARRTRSPRESGVAAR